MAISHGKASASGNGAAEQIIRSRVRARRACHAFVSLAAIEPRRLYEKDDDRHRVDEKPARIGQKIFAAGIEYAEHQRREQRALQAAKATDRHHNQEQHQIEHRKTWRRPSN